MLDKLAAAGSSSACPPVAAALRLQAAMHSVIGFVAHQDWCREHSIAEAPGLLQQVQRTLALLPNPSAPGDSSSSSSSSSAGSVAAVVAAVVPLQQVLLQLLYKLCSDGAVDVGVLDASRADDSSAVAAMQLLCAYTYLMYAEHTAAAVAAGGAQQQQQRPHGDNIHGMRARDDSSAASAASGSSNSSSSNSRSDSRRGSACSASSKRPVQAGLSPISPVHDALQLIPAAWRQLYLREVLKAAQMEAWTAC
jgi:hypothetical protein